MSFLGQPRRRLAGTERDLLGLISAFSPAQREFISNSLKKKTQEDEARCSKDLVSLEITGVGQHVLVVGPDGVFLRQIEDQVSYLIFDSFTFLRAMYRPSFYWERKLGDPKKWISTDCMELERKGGESSLHAWVNTFDDGGTFQENRPTRFDIFEVRALLDSVMPSIGRLLVLVKANVATVHVEYARFPDFPVLQFQRDLTRFGSVHRMLIERFGANVAGTARIDIIDPD